MAEAGARQAIRTVARLLRPAPVLPVAAPDEAPAAGGAYALAIELASPLEISLGRRSGSLLPGIYVYAGSAYGPGGIRARLRRHFRRDKKVHWHVDWLTVCASGLEALAIEGGSECRIAGRLAGLPSFVPVMDGFGSSDCRRCATHLLQWLDGSPPPR